MADEAGFWRSCVRPALFSEGIAERIENVLALGTPDVVYSVGGVGGLLELKDADGWPKRGGPLTLPHYTAEQRQWHRAWRARGGRVHLALRVQGAAVTYADDLSPRGQKTPAEFFLFDAAVAAEVLGAVDRSGLIAAAVRHWTGTLPKRDFCRALTL